MDDERQWTDIPRMLLTFVLVVIGWIFFRASDMASCWDYFSGICQLSLFTLPVVENALLLWATIAAIIVMLIIEWTKQLPNRWWLYYGLLVAIWWFAGQDVDFIYFQF